MQLTIEYQAITDLFRKAAQEGRRFLYEYEVYTLLSLSGSETPPRCAFIPKNAARGRRSHGSSRRKGRAEDSGRLPSSIRRR